MPGIHEVGLYEASALLPAETRHGFSFPTPEAAEELRCSVGQFGILLPLLCRMEVEGPRVVSGVRRLEAARHAGRGQVPVRDVTHLATVDLWNLLLEERAATRPLNPAETGLYLKRRLADTGETPGTLPAFVFERLGIPPRGTALDDFLWIADLPADLQGGFADGSFPLQGVRILSRAARADGLAVLELLGRRRVGVNRFGEIVRLILECAYREGLDVEAWLRREGVGAGCASGEELRDRLRGLRYPTLVEWETSFAADAAALGLPVGARLGHSRGFEGGQLFCTIGFRSLPELQLALEGLSGLLQGGRLDVVERYFG